jgi:hypothetical protein
MSTTTCVLLGVDVEVDFDYYPPCGDGWHEPETPEEIIINSVIYKDLDLYGEELLRPKDFDKLEEQISEMITDSIDPYRDYK